MDTVAHLEAALTEPSSALVRDLVAMEGDIVIVGCAGKMGPTLACLAQRALEHAAVHRRVIAVSRFSDGAVRARLETAGIQTVAADLLDARQIAALPEAPNVIYMLGTKFGTTGREYLTWATNAHLPGRVAERYAKSRLVIFSSGNVYPLMSVTSGGATEASPPQPIGEYAQSCLARERIFEYFSRQSNLPMTIVRLNYAIDLRYGVLLDIGRAVHEGRPIDLRMGNANVIWQGDANEFALRSLTVSSVPPKVLNVTGPETMSIRWLAEQFGERFGTAPVFAGTEAPTALISNAAEAFRLFGYPRVPVLRMIQWTAHWIEIGGPTLDKPTHFQEREGQF